MSPYPVEVAHNQTGNTLCFLPNFSKLVLPPVPPSSLLTNDAVGALQSLRVLLANNVFDLNRQYPLITAPVVRIPKLAVRCTFGACDQVSQQRIRVLPDPSAENQPIRFV